MGKKRVENIFKSKFYILNMEIGIIGYVSRDIVTKEKYNSRIEKIGGKAYYSGIAMSNMGVPSVIAIHVDKNSQDFVREMQKPNIDLHVFYSKKTPEYENYYPEKDLNIRQWKAMLDKFEYSVTMANDMLDKLIKCGYILIYPTRPKEISPKFIEFIKENTSAKLVTDLDFWCKEVLDNGVIKEQEKEFIDKILSYFDIIFVAEEDKARIVNGNEEHILKYIAEKGPSEVIITKGSKGALIYSKEERKFYKINAVKPKKLVDTTGAGDTFIAAYVVARSKKKGIKKAGEFAAKVASEMLQYSGALSHKINI